MGSRRLREQWAEVVRRRTADLRERVARRLWGPADRRPAGDGPRPAAPAAPAPPGPPGGRRYDPGSVVLGWVTALALGVLFLAGWQWLFDYELLPRVHPMDLQPGDQVEVGTSGAYRPAVVRDPDGSATNTGPIPSYLSMLRVFPPLLAAGLAGWLVVLRGALPRPAAEPGAAVDRAGGSR